MNARYVAIGVISAFFLIGCGDNKDEEVNSSSKNVLNIKAKGVDTHLVFDFNKMDYSLTAYGNDSDIFLGFGNLNSEQPIYGQIGLFSAEKQANIYALAWSNENKSTSSLWCFDDCKSNTEYNYDSINRKLNINFNNNKNKLMKDVVSGLGNQEEKIEAIISGKLELNVPSNWIAFNKNRFPVLSETGGFLLDGKEYKIYDIKSDVQNYNENGNEYLGDVEDIYLKNGDDVVYLTIYNKVEGTNSFNNIRVRVVLAENNGEYWSGEQILTASDIEWNNGKNFLALNLKSINIYNLEKNNTKSLNTNLVIPINTENLVINGEKAYLNFSNSSSNAISYNDQKQYSITIKNKSKHIGIGLIQQFNGNITLRAYDGKEEKICGDRDTPCLGLSMDNDKKTFRFNHVQLGNDILNGEIYIAGILNTR